MFDSHIHSIHSHDGKESIDFICQQAIKKGLRGIAITDHCEINEFDAGDTKNRLKHSICDIEKAKKKYAGTLSVIRGIELAQYLSAPDTADCVLEKGDYDFVLGSVHSIKDMPSYSRRDYGAMKKEDCLFAIRKYYETLYETAVKGKFDVLSHITYPFRYINGRCHQNYTTHECMDIIEAILKHIIKNNQGIELNMSGLFTSWGQTMPPLPLLKFYYSLGGRIVTVGSDAHIAKQVGVGIKEGYEMLKEAGFSFVSVFHNRIPDFIKIKP